MARRERNILDRAVYVVAERQPWPTTWGDETIAVKHSRSDPLVTTPRWFALELLKAARRAEDELRAEVETLWWASVRAMYLDGAGVDRPPRPRSTPRSPRIPGIDRRAQAHGRLGGPM
jgi:hypothetical protein